MNQFAMLFPPRDTYDDACNYAWGYNCMTCADELIERHASSAEQLATAWAMTLDDERLGFGSLHRTPEQKAGLWLQAQFWLAVRREIMARSEEA